MSIPTDPQQPGQPEVPQPEAPQSYDAPQPTAAYPAGGFAAEQPTVPQAPYGQPEYAAAPGYAQPAQPGYGQPEYAQPGYAQPGYGQPVYGQPGAPVPPGDRSKTMAIIALVLAIVGLVMAFIPVVNVFAGILLLPAFILAIIALVKKNQGGKPFSIAALIISVIGWIVSIIMIVVFFIAAAAGAALDNRPLPSASSSSETDEGTVEEPGTEVEAGAYDEAAFIDAAKPTVVEILAAAIPDATPELVATMFPDEVLLALGQAIVAQDTLNGGTMDAEQEKVFRDAFVDSMAQSGGITTEAAGQFYDAVASAARAHLVK